MVEVSGLTKNYGSHRALDNLSFTLRDGEITGLLGLNGAGKSTTMNIITGCLSAGSGKVLINGIDIEAEPERAKLHIGYLPEIPPLYTDMKVREYLDFVCDIKRVGEGRKERMEAIRAGTGIGEVYGRLIGNLSKGYRQRVGLAAALTGNPAVLVLDEPTVGLDPAQIIEIRNLILELGKTCTVLLSSHILQEVQAVCGRVIVLHEGRIAADLRNDEMGSGASLEKIFIDLVKGAEG
ncbi:MAG: ABC transporter ATP-binding protein [Spirochaetaceae bacterium]|jgi:ABC-2 type transport system ATP-binding protein|nr:ABC transporter ATP-binding protein [Spirochaetaceae bacterium]